MALHIQKSGEKNKLCGFLKRHRIKLCAIILAIVLGVSLIPSFLNDSVAYAADAVLWGHKDNDGIAKIRDGEIAYYSDDPAVYNDKMWGKYLLGGINRVDKLSLPESRSSLLVDKGTGLMDKYTDYSSKNVSVVRYSGGKDSNLGISVNSQGVGYIKMNVSSESGRYLYYSIAVTSLSGGTGYGTFAVGLEGEAEIAARTENNKCGGVAYVSNPLSYSDKDNWVSGYEYGCIDLKALTGDDSKTVNAVYLFGNEKSKVLLNYLIISNEAPSKIDVANGNVVYGSGDGSDGFDRDFSDKSGEKGTATMTLEYAQAFSFENLVIDTEFTPYLYYSFKVSGTNKAPITFKYNGTEYSVGNGATKSITGCIKIDEFIKDEGILCFTDANGRGFSFGNGINLEIRYLYFSMGLDVSKGENVIVKNADSINIEAKSDYRLDDFKDGSLDASYTYKQKTNSDGSNGVWAPYVAEIKTAFEYDLCWYVSTNGTSMEGAKSLGVTYKSYDGAVDKTYSNLEFEIDGINVKASLEIKDTGSRRKLTTLKILNPTKQQYGLYFFCLVVAKNDSGSYKFSDVIKASDLTTVKNHIYLSTGLCRLDVANNIVYHKVNQEGKELGISNEDWLLYGSSSKVTDAFEMKFAADGGYLCYPLNTVATESNYSLPSYNYVDIESTVKDVEFNGWMLFTETIKNPNSDKALQNYINIYDVEYRYDSKVQYNSSVIHSYWQFKLPYEFALSGERNKILHDTTINLYTGWRIPVKSNVLDFNVLVDRFGTNIIASQTEDGKFVYATKDENGKNNFVGKVYVAVSPKEADVTIEGGKLQYSVDGGVWTDVADASSLVIYGFDGNDKDGNGKTTVSNAKNWYKENTQYSKYSNDIKYAAWIDTESTLEKFGKTSASNKKELVSELTLEFRYITGVTNSDSWFNFVEIADCGTIRFVPLKYANLD